MTQLSLSVITLLTAISTPNLIPLAYAEPVQKQSQVDESGAGCIGCSGSCRSSGLSSPTCVGAGCMGL